MQDKKIKKTLRNIYIMLIAILCLTIISSTAILSYVFVHSNDKKVANNNPNSYEYDVSKFKEISYDEFMKLYKKDEQSLIYIGRSTCIHCVNFIPVLKQAQKDYGYKTYYLDISKINEKQMQEIKKLDSFLEKNFGGTPMVIIVKDEAILNNGWIGESDYETFSKYLEDTGYKKR